MANWPAMVKHLAAGALIVSLAACTAIYRNHGYAPTDDELSFLVVGVDTQATVEEAVGRPSATGVLNEGGWYYVSSRWRHFAYRAPEVIDRQVVAISFVGEEGTIANIERFTLEDGQIVPLSRRVTDSSVQGTSFLRQLLGNIGQLDPTSLLD